MLKIVKLYWMEMYYPVLESGTVGGLSGLGIP